MKGDGRGAAQRHVTHLYPELNQWWVLDMCKHHEVELADVYTVGAILLAWLEKSTGVAEPMTAEHIKVSIKILRALRSNARARRIAGPGGTTS